MEARAEPRKLLSLDAHKPFACNGHHSQCHVLAQPAAEKITTQRITPALASLPTNFWTSWKVMVHFHPLKLQPQWALDTLRATSSSITPQSTLRSSAEGLHQSVRNPMGGCVTQDLPSPQLVSLPKYMVSSLPPLRTTMIIRCAWNSVSNWWVSLILSEIQFVLLNSFLV